MHRVAGAGFNAKAIVRERATINIVFAVRGLLFVQGNRVAVVFRHDVRGIDGGDAAKIRIAIGDIIPKDLEFQLFRGAGGHIKIAFDPFFFIEPRKLNGVINRYFVLRTLTTADAIAKERNNFPIRSNRGEFQVMESSAIGVLRGERGSIDGP